MTEFPVSVGSEGSGRAARVVNQEDLQRGPASDGSAGHDRAARCDWSGKVTG